jgi:LysM repeat protein
MGAQESPDPDTVSRAAPDRVERFSAIPPLDPRFAACPYVLVPTGGFRFAHPDREHRCTAARPFESPSTDKQRRLCLTAGYGGCPTYTAARLRRGDAFADAGIPIDALQSRHSRPLGHTTPVVVVGGHRSPGTLGMGSPVSQASRGTTRAPGSAGARPALATEAGIRPHATGGRPGSARGGGPRGPRAAAGPAVAAVVVLAALAVLVARMPGAAGPSPAPPTPLATVAAAVSQPPTVSPTVGASPGVTTAVVSAAPTASPVPATRVPASAAATTYRVRAGDTLIGIASRFGVTVTALQQANGITDPRLLRVGQVLQIP